MSRLTKWYKDLKQLQGTGNADCGAIRVYDDVPPHMAHVFCDTCVTCELNKQNFDEWFEELFNKE